MCVREYCEDKILTRLMKQLPTDLPDSVVEGQFKSLFPALDIIIHQVLNEVNITIFTDEDLTSFFYLKTHQILRRGQYNLESRSKVIFYRSFKNLCYDIIKMMTRAERRGDEMDMLYYVKEEYTDLVAYYYSVDT